MIPKLLLIIALSAAAVGQTRPKAADGWDAAEHAYVCVKDGKQLPPSKKSCAKLGAKPTIWPTIASVQIQLTERQRNAYESNKWMKPCGQNNHDDGCYVPDDPCDGFSCTGPVEMLKGANDGDRHPLVARSPDERVNLAILDAPNGSQVILIFDSEYSHLQQLRVAVVEEEKRLAVKYGAHQFVHHPYIPPTICIPEGCPRPTPDTPADRYEFHGQFLLIEKTK